MANQTSVNNEFKDDLSVNTATSARDISLTIKNTDNTSVASHAKLNITTGGASGGDPKLTLSNTTVSSSIGIDNSDSDNFKMAHSSSLETTTVLDIKDGGIRRPLQSAFLARLDTPAQNNVTGNSSSYSVIFESEAFDQNSDYNNITGVFTAPIDGNYYFSASIVATGSIVAKFLRADLNTSDWKYTWSYSRPCSSSNIGAKVSCVAPMDSGDTAYISIIGIGEAGDTLDLPSGSPEYKWFSGILLQ